jgi:hypothetical protein
MIRKGLRPGFKFGFDMPGEGDDFRLVLPFRRSWVAIAILAVMDIVFLIPAVLTFQQAIVEWGQFDSLFDLVGALFLSAWLLGWIIAPLIMTTILAVMLFGREVLKASPGVVEIFFGIAIFGVTVRYDVSKLRNLRFEHPMKNSGKSWRGPHLVFDYGANTVAVGSAINGDEVPEIRRQLKAATGQDIRHGDALPSEIETKWEQDEVPTPEASPTAPLVSSEPLTLVAPSTLLLIIANLIPIAGSIFLDWNLGDVMVLYWAESAIIGFFNVCKLAVISRWMVLLVGPFFIGHFGGFMAIHFLFLYTIFVKPQSEMVAGDDLADVAQLFIILWPALAALFISHAFSFYKNFLGRFEYRDRTLNQQMTEPYSRIIFMHLVLIFGGGLTLILGNPAPVLLLVIGLKIYFDVKAHLKQHAGSPTG